MNSRKPAAKWMWPKLTRRMFPEEQKQNSIASSPMTRRVRTLLRLPVRLRQQTFWPCWKRTIGPVTSETLRQAGFKTNIEALEYTMEGLALAIAKHVLTTHPSE